MLVLLCKVFSDSFLEVLVFFICLFVSKINWGGEEERNIDEKMTTKMWQNNNKKNEDEKERVKNEWKFQENVMLNECVSTKYNKSQCERERERERERESKWVCLKHIRVFKKIKQIRKRMEKRRRKIVDRIGLMMRRKTRETFAMTKNDDDGDDDDDDD